MAGEGIADYRWTESRKKRIWESRISGTQNLVSALASLEPHLRPKVLVSGSAIGYYAQNPHPQDEESPVGQGFLAELCEKWEENAQKAQQLGLRTVVLRTGLVLSKEGGVLDKTGPAVLGSGRQWMSWIHIEDVVRFILFAIKNENLQGAYNLTAPNPVTNSDFTQSVSKTKGIPFTTKVPSIVLKIILGEMSEAVLASHHVLPRKALSAGFNFRFEKLETALQDLIGGRSFFDNYFSARQFIPLDRKEVFPFFSRAENLEVLTPPWLNFHIENKSTSEIQKGTLINYKLKIHGIPVRWRTLISDWKLDESFTDDQLKGPYSKWHHVHTFESVLGGTLISDEITYQAPGWIFGKILLPMIRKDIKEIFQYRQSQIKKIYSKNHTL